jgi:hypothetical protein
MNGIAIAVGILVTWSPMACQGAQQRLRKRNGV